MVLRSLGVALSRTRQRLREGIQNLISGKRTIDPDLLERLEGVLLGADLGVRITQRLIETLRETSGRREPAAPSRLIGLLKQDLAQRMKEREGRIRSERGVLQVIMGVGINGVGKTTTLGKLAWRFKSQGRTVMLVAGDTFRAAAIEQLEIWGERAGAAVIKHQPGGDPSAVIFDGLQAARARGTEVVLVDTAGRMHTRNNLMEELKKMKRVMDKAVPGSPHEVLLVLDATTGQNALSQARQFHEAVGVTGVALSKLDGSSKGGVVVAVSEELGLPVKLVGVGEGIGDLEDFSADEFVEGLLGE